MDFSIVYITVSAVNAFKTHLYCTSGAGRCSVIVNWLSSVVELIYSVRTTLSSGDTTASSFLNHDTSICRWLSLGNVDVH